MPPSPSGDLISYGPIRVPVASATLLPEGGMGRSACLYTQPTQEVNAGGRSHSRHFFGADFQFNISTMGVMPESSTRVLMRNRPSRETVYSGMRFPIPPVATRV